MADPQKPVADEFDQYKTKPAGQTEATAGGDEFDQYKVQAPPPPAAESDIRDTIIHSMDPDLSGPHPIKNTLLGAGQGISNLLLHPVQSFMAGAPTSGGSGYPGMSYTGNKDADEANANLMTQRSRDASEQGQQLVDSFKQSPAHTIGRIAGPLALTYGAAKLFPRISGPIGESMKGAGANLIDRTAGSINPDFAHGSQPGRAYLEGGGTPALTMRGLANKAEAINERTGAQVGEVYRNASGVPVPPRAPVGLLPAAPTTVPLGEAPAPIDVPGELIPARRMSTANVVGPGPEPNPLQSEIGSVAGTVPPRIYRNPFVTGGAYEPEPVPAGPSGPGVMVTRDPAVANQFNPPSSEPYTLPRPRMSGLHIPADAVRAAVNEPLNQLRSLQEGPGGTGTSSELIDYERRLNPPIEAAERRGGFTPDELFQEMKRPIGRSTRWNDPKLFDLNSVRQQTAGALGGLLTDAVPEAEKLNRIYQGTENLAKRADARANTGQIPLTAFLRKGSEGAWAALGYGTGHPLIGALPMAVDTVPGKTSLAYGLFHGAKAAPLFNVAPRLLIPGATGAGRVKRVDEENPDDESRR